MPLKKLSLRPGVNRENTRYTNENGWYESQWMRFRQGTPEKIGGFVPVGDEDGLYPANQRLPGIARAITLAPSGAYVGSNYGVYIKQATTSAYVPALRPAAYYSSNPISAYYIYAIDASLVTGEITVTISEDSALAQYLKVMLFMHGGSMTTPIPVSMQFVNITNGTPYAWTWPDMTPLAPIPYRSPIYDSVKVNLGSAYGAGYIDVTVQGLGTVATGSSLIPGNSGWAYAVFNSSANDPTSYDLGSQGFHVNWSLSAFGNQMVFNWHGDNIWVGTYSTGFNSLLTSSPTPPTATAAPLIANMSLVSDVSRFLMVFGTTDNETPTINPYYNPMLVRWADQETTDVWEPAATNQAGSLQLSRGSKIMAVQQARQEILVWTDIALYSLQYVGAPIVWSAQLVGENISIASQDCVAYANGVAYWMGHGKFYKYSGTVQTLRCDLRKYIFEDLDTTYYVEVTAGTNERFNEVWWRYVSDASTDKTSPDKYVVYNYVEDVWYYGTDSSSVMADLAYSLETGPIKAVAFYDPAANPAGFTSDYYSVIFDTEYKNDAYYNGQGDYDPVAAIPAYITSAEFDLDDGHQFMFVWRMLPDVTFAGSDAVAPSVQFALLPMKNSGSGVTNPASVGGDNEATILSLGLEPTYTIEKFTGQVFTRVRARQMMIEISSDGLGVAWQLGSPRLDMRADGRR